jgi:molecular chaperone DnaK (HSP70)
MKLGVDFGTTRIVVAFVDRGNYPVVAFEAPDASTCEWFPPLVAVKGENRLYGWEAWAAQEDPTWTVIRSLKRSLESAGPETRVHIADQIVPMRVLLSELASALRVQLLQHSTLPSSSAEPHEVMLGVPANANSNQRFLTVEAFRQAGFRVLGLLNEPSAASLEFGHRNRGMSPAKSKCRILVYDLGGGTFDASLVELDDRERFVIASEGISTLGGDDFDSILADLALEAAGLTPEEQAGLSQAEHFRLHEECREKKESLHPNTRRIVIDLGRIRAGRPEVSLPVSDFYEQCRPLIDETLHATEDLLAAYGYDSTSTRERQSAGQSTSSDGDERLEALYITGGGSELPAISRMLREVFGRRVRRSAYTRSATAIGLAIQADAESGYTVREKFTRYFGVWREAERGEKIIFDPVFPKGSMLPKPDDPPLTGKRRYEPVHNIGHFRYLECSHVTEEGRPAGDITLWDDICFPFEPSLQHKADLSGVAVTRREQVSRPEIEERYACDASGTLMVTITNVSEGYSREYRLGRWAAASAPVIPGRKRKSAPKK